ncbi:Cytochrome bo(3) ubiquinol oxidase subunit 4 [Chlamydiales bacterium STE3]|nr:Cytochrome bo(3) ubiquinol oxidase subunit 4 [Chlamydiales bacterium STE3]
MSGDISLKQAKNEWHGTLSSYIIGFIASVILTAISFFLVTHKQFTEQVTIYLLVSLAVIQAIFQLRFFLHLGQEAKPKWETIIFYTMLVVLLIISIGSLWVMNDLNARMMPDMNMEMLHD